MSLGHRSYDILIGDDLLEVAGHHCAKFMKRKFTVIVTDENVAKHHLKTLEASLHAEGIKTKEIGRAHV